MLLIIINSNALLYYNNFHQKSNLSVILK